MESSILAEMIFQGCSSIAVMEDMRREGLPAPGCNFDESFNTPMCCCIPAEEGEGLVQAKGMWEKRVMVGEVAHSCKTAVWKASCLSCCI